MRIIARDNDPLAAIVRAYARRKQRLLIPRGQRERAKTKDPEQALPWQCLRTGSELPCRARRLQIERDIVVTQSLCRVDIAAIIEKPERMPGLIDCSMRLRNFVGTRLGNHFGQII
ncbi:hypothetical protein HYPDE_26278 [Hyphomicrobium denitrificans 1NES1]|uniref:Uncharacterized protein n=1 Tax=Hyphomicrobium denitrificans 1NES1 TaxID=670307 RepID=N0B1W7_9HYPH|nr:hypothetical protein HYPDE_26278 [Hyphomicrobium denitrificans 1NES1]